MQSKFLHLGWGVLPLLSVACGGSSEGKASEKKPLNIVYIMSDDHSYQFVSCYDRRYISTPNIDRLAEGGVRFTESFVANSLSGPSRACMLTGKHSHLNGKINNEYHARFDQNQLTMPKVLQAGGYQTALVGKLHLEGIPQGFDHWIMLPGQGDYYDPRFVVPRGEQGTDTIQHQGYVTNIITDLSLTGSTSVISKSLLPFLYTTRRLTATGYLIPSMFLDTKTKTIHCQRPSTTLMRGDLPPLHSR